MPWSSPTRVIRARKCILSSRADEKRTPSTSPATDPELQAAAPALPVGSGGGAGAAVCFAPKPQAAVPALPNLYPLGSRRRGLFAKERPGRGVRASRREIGGDGAA